MWNATIGAEELSYISSYQTLWGDKNWKSYKQSRISIYKLAHIIRATTTSGKTVKGSGTLKPPHQHFTYLAFCFLSQAQAVFVSIASNIQVQDLAPCPTMEKGRVTKMERGKVRGRQNFHKQKSWGLWSYSQNMFKEWKFNEVTVKQFSENQKMVELELENFCQMKSQWNSS